MDKNLQLLAQQEYLCILGLKVLIRIQITGGNIDFGQVKIITLFHTGVGTMGSMHIRKAMRLKRKKRIRKDLSGTPDRPRLTVFRSAGHIYAQIIDDTNGQTLVSASTMEKDFREGKKAESKVEAASRIGKVIGERATDKGIKSVVFDRNGYMYHGRVKAVSEGAREIGLNF